jgi:RHS repeat-associated protein
MPGQDYANARYYSANSGSFWSQDSGGMKTATSENPTTWNRYAYVAGDPVNAIDPKGTDLVYVSGGAQDCTDNFTETACGDPCT